MKKIQLTLAQKEALKINKYANLLAKIERVWWQVRGSLIYRGLNDF
jgi:hypothetical protein